MTWKGVQVERPRIIVFLHIKASWRFKLINTLGICTTRTIPLVPAISTLYHHRQMLLWWKTYRGGSSPKGAGDN